MMALTAAEQYMLELINRTRLDPLGEAARQGIGLNDGLSAGTLDGHARQVLAPNALLERAATAHSQWQLAEDVFSHEGRNGSSPTQRVQATGYATGFAGENLAWRGTTGSINLNEMARVQHDDLFASALHRKNMLTDSYREVGVSQETGRFFTQGHDFNSSMITQNFASSGTNFFVTGVAYNDRNTDGFYSIGEGLSGVQFASGGRAVGSAAAGGYALRVIAGGEVDVTGTVGTLAFSVEVDVSRQNAKLDIVNGTMFMTSADISLGTGINRATLLGVADLDASGNGRRNILIGNKGDNGLSGNAGVDRLYGRDGDDDLQGGNGYDILVGGAGRDTLDGGAGNDILTGGSDVDVFVFRANGGADRITDFSSADQLRLDDAIWGGATKTAAQVVSAFGEMVNGHAVLDFGNGQTITVVGMQSLSALAGEITVI
jgi:serralysin